MNSRRSSISAAGSLYDLSHHQGYAPGPSTHYRTPFNLTIATSPSEAEQEAASGPVKKTKKSPLSPYRSRSNSFTSSAGTGDEDGVYEDDVNDADWSPVSERVEASPFAVCRRPSIASSATSADWDGDAHHFLGGLSVGDPQARLDNIAALARTGSTPSACDRHRTSFVHTWLGCLYAPGEGNVSRRALYASYEYICEHYGMKPVNVASFGKAVRATFPDIKTRRLGVRGASRYHYCGMQPASLQERQNLDRFTDLDKQRSPGHSRNDSHGHSSQTDGDEEDGGDEEYLDSPQEARILRHANSAPDLASPVHMAFSEQSRFLESDVRHRSETLHRRNTLSGSDPASLFIKAEPPAPLSIAQRIASFPSLVEIPDVASWPAASAMYADFELFAGQLLDCAAAFRFEHFDGVVRQFYDRQAQDADRRAVIDHPVVGHLMLRADAALYEAILALLGKRMAEPIQGSFLPALRHVADNMEQIILLALQPYSPTVSGPKIELAARFGHLLIRHLGLCQLTQALTSILGNQQTCQAMAKSFAQVDLDQILNHCALMFACSRDPLAAIFDESRQMLADRAMRHDPSLSNFIVWLDVVYDRLVPDLQPRELILRTSFVTSQLLRDLTLRSDPSFGSFQIAIGVLQEAWGLRAVRVTALQVAAISTSVDAAQLPPPSQATIPAMRTQVPAPLPLRASALAYSGSTYLAVSPAQARFDDALQVPSPTYDALTNAISPRTAQAFVDAARYDASAAPLSAGSSGQLLAAPMLSAGVGQTPTPMALTFADRWRSQQMGCGEYEMTLKAGEGD